MLVDDYFDCHQKFQDKYVRVVVLYEVGKFFELYGVDNEEEKIGDVAGIAQLLNIQATKKNRAVEGNSRKNPFMCGFPKASLKRFLDVLVADGYTCVVVEQTSGPPRPKREVTYIASPGTYVDDSSFAEDNNLSCLCFQKERSDVVILGFANVDVNTGASFVYETVGVTDELLCIQEAVRLLKSFNPREVLVGFFDFKEGNVKIQESIDFGQRVLHVLPDVKEARRVNFMNQFLSGVFDGDQTGFLSPIEFLALENQPTACAAYVSMLRFVLDHNDAVLQKLSTPCRLNDMSRCVLENNAVQQLNVLSSQNKSVLGAPGSLFDVVNKCSTALGRRELRNRLCMPLTNAADISLRHDAVDKLSSGSLFDSVLRGLRAIPDVQKLIRKFDMDNGAPEHLYKIWRGLQDWEVIRKDLAAALAVDTEAVLADLNSTFDLERLEKLVENNEELNIFRPDSENEQTAELEEISIAIQDEKAFLESIAKGFGTRLDVPVKLEYSDKDHYHIVTTDKRAATLKTSLTRHVMHVDTQMHVWKYPEEALISGSQITSASTGNLARLTCDSMKQSGNRLLESVSRLQTIQRQLFGRVSKTLIRKHKALLADWCVNIASLDCAASAAKVAADYGYVRPCLQDPGTSGDSSFEMTNGRHPIIERLQTGTAYVPNSLTLNSDVSGMLLYGCNSAGKSSLMKTIGLCVILAQAGLFVPAEKFTLAPFQNIMTRILGNDDLFKGQSSFATEMAELRSILTRSDSRTLVLGDEVANSTESTSGLAIVAAAVTRMSTRNVKFIFATHLHELAKMPRVCDLPNVRHYHMQITYDPVLDALVYDRLVREGSGNAIYGLEIAKAMGLSNDFLELAHSIRREILKTEETLVSTKSSRYNAKVLIKPCEVCGNPGEDVHHIKHQKLADDKGLITGSNGLHKNDLANLVVLCTKCHDKIHGDESLTVDQWVTTTKGRKLAIQEPSNPFKKFACRREEVRKNLISAH